MKAVPSPPPPVKNRLSKPQTNHNTTTTSTRISRSVSQLSCALLHNNQSSEQLPVRTSYIDLKNRPEARRELRRQLSTTFPETQEASPAGRGDTSLDSTSSPAPSMGMKDRFRPGPMPTVGQNESALSSSSTVDSLGQAVQMMGAESKTIDVEAAINLLQELKKNASPEELVALHRALLPMRDVETISSPVKDGYGDRSPFFNQSSTRRSSKLPPGLATRGGADEDLLRRQGEQPMRQKRGSRQFDLTPSPPERKESFTVEQSALLDSSDETPSAELSRARTPTDERYSHMGHYKHGSLRITNGAASPEPGRLIRDLEEAVESEPVIEPQRKSSLDFHPGRSAGDQAATQSVRERILHSAREPKRGLWASRTSGAAGTQEWTSKLLAQPQTPLQMSTSNLERSPEQDVSSPVSAPPSVPRHQQWFPRRESTQSLHSPETNKPTASPEQPAPSVMNFASRLSTVFGEDQDADGVSGTPADALSKLTGEVNAPRAVRRRSSPSKPRYYAKATTEDVRPAKAKHTDSGYGSDERRFSAAAPGSQKDGHRIERHPTVRDSYTNIISQGEADENSDGKSLYTFNEFIHSPDSDSSRPSLARALTSKKSRFLALRSKSSSKRNSAPVSPSYPPQHFNDSVQTIESTQGSLTERSSRQPRKLQKPAPKDLKKSRSLRKTVLREAASAEALPSNPSHGAATGAQRSNSETQASQVDHAGGDAEASESQDDLTPLPEDEATDVGQKPSDHKRSLSRGRRALTTGSSSAEDLTDLKKSSSFFRKRSKSRSRSTKRTNEAAHTDDEATTTDFSPMTDPLGSGPYDLSTNQFNRRPQQSNSSIASSPWQISTGILKSKSTTGMNEEMASELARKKSRDVALRTAEANQERPRMATPKKGKKDRSATVKPPVPQTSNRSVEDFYPDWQSKAAAPAPTQTVPQRAYSMYAESVPPMPDLPLDVAAKAKRAEEMVAKKMKGSPGGSARHSLEPPPVPKTFAEAKKEQDVALEDEKKANEDALQLLHPAVRPKSTDEDVNVKIRELNNSASGSGSDTESRTTASPRPDDRHNERDEDYQPAAPAPSVSPNHDAQHPGWPGWESQAKLWRDRRLAASQPHNQEPTSPNIPIPDSATLPHWDSSPSIVVSRYITPLSNDIANRARTEMASEESPSDALRHADEYRNLLADAVQADEKSSNGHKGKSPPRPTPPHPDTAPPPQHVHSYTSTGSPAQRRTPTRADSAFDNQHTWKSQTNAANSHATTTTTTQTSTQTFRRPAHRQRSPTVGNDGTYQAYRPAPPPHGSSSTTTMTTMSTRGGNGKPDRPALSTTNTGISSSTANTTASGVSSARAQDFAVPDRFSGGLQYEWHPQSGFGGSAGTRTSGSRSPERRRRLEAEVGGPRRGMGFAQTWGVDLGDVPVFLRRQ